MYDLIAFLTAAVCMTLCIRIIAFRRRGSRYRPVISFVAYLLAATSGCQALATLLGVYLENSPFVLVILTILCVQVCRVRGNLAAAWHLSWNGTERRKGAA